MARGEDSAALSISSLAQAFERRKSSSGRAVTVEQKRDAETAVGGKSLSAVAQWLTPVDTRLNDLATAVNPLTLKVEAGSSLKPGAELGEESAAEETPATHPSHSHSSVPRH